MKELPFLFISNAGLFVWYFPFLSLDKSKKPAGTVSKGRERACGTKQDSHPDPLLITLFFPPFVIIFNAHLFFFLFPSFTKKARLGYFLFLSVQNICKAEGGKERGAAPFYKNSSKKSRAIRFSLTRFFVPLVLLRLLSCKAN